MSFTIAIDGPAGAGKSTVADDVAQALGILHLDTGAMYRAFAYQALKEGVSCQNEKALTALTQRTMPRVSFENGRQRTFIDGEDVTEKIHTPEISQAASDVSRFAGVRKAMVKSQQELAQTQSIIMDGRDIGTVVLPNATLKVFLTATPETRARRRCDEMLAKGQEADYETVLADVVARDKQDTSRKVTPLRQAEDAILVDSSYQTQKQVTEYILRLLRFKQGKKQIPVEKLNFMAHFFRGVLWLISHTIFPVTFHHVERALISAPYMLIANHQVFTDPFVASHPIIYLYFVRFLGKQELMKNAFTRWFLQKQLRMIPVRRDEPDMPAMRACLKVLKEGHVLGIFPEGTRYKEGVMDDLDTGTALMAMRTNSLLLPCYIDRPLGLFRRTNVYYGKPFSLNEFCKDGLTNASAEEANCYISGIYKDFVQNPEE